MLSSQPLGRRPMLTCLVYVFSMLAPAAALFAQDPAAAPPGSPAAGLPAPSAPATGDAAIKFKVTGPAQKLEMAVNTSRVLEFGFDVPKMLVNNPELVRVIPISPNEIQLSAVKAGVTQLNVWDNQGTVTTLDLIVLGDVQELDLVLKTEFPDASIRLRPLNSSLYISGFVPKAEMVASIIRVAEDYFPKVVNGLQVGGVQKVLLHVKVMEVSRTKLRTLGFDWAAIGEQAFATQGVAGLLSGIGSQTGNPPTPVRFGIVDGNTQFYGFLEALRQNDLAKLVAEPTLTTLNGRPASFNVGGEVPVLVPQSLGTVTVQYREFGTQIDFVPIVLGNGVVRLEVRPNISELDASNSVTLNGAVIPGFKTRRADVGAEMKVGQTLAIAGLVYTRVEAQNKGLPWLADLPWFGSPFRRVSEKKNEVELVILVRPEFAEAMDPCEVPPCGPGEFTTSPTDVELYHRGYLEVPKGGPGFGPGACGPGMGPDGVPYGGAIMPQGYEQVQPGMATPINSDTRWPSQNAAQSRTAARAPQPTPAARATSSRPVSVSISSDSRPIGTSQNPTSRYQGRASAQKPTPARQPSLIGPLGYDDLK